MTNKSLKLASIKHHADEYSIKLKLCLDELDWKAVNELGEDLVRCLQENRKVFICGNGGSGANAIHIANDFLYGISKRRGVGLNCTALTANSSVLTCLANDEDYSEVFAFQLAVQAESGDILIALSGSGNSPNITRAIDEANSRNLKTYTIVGFDGGEAKRLAHVPIHINVNDMQVSEDAQMIIAHIISQWMFENIQGKI